MGAVHFSLDPHLVGALRQVLPLEVMLETGTFQGDTARVMADLFKEVHTVELSPFYFEMAHKRLAAWPNVRVYHEGADACLRRLAPRLRDRSVLYWLDAHWCSAEGDTAAACPLLQELAALSPLNDSSVVLIDDARLFLAPPPPPHEVDQWPSFPAVQAALGRLGGRHELLVVNDILVFTPPGARQAVLGYAREYGADWLSLADKARGYDAMLHEMQRMLHEMQRKEVVIHTLHAAAEERLRLINRLHGLGAEQQLAIAWLQAEVARLQDELSRP